MHACPPSCRCEIRRYWSEYRRGFYDAALSWISISFTADTMAEWESLSFCSASPPTPENSQKTCPVREGVWMMYGALICDKAHPTLFPTTCVFRAFVLLLAGRWGQLLEEEADCRHSCCYRSSPLIYLLSIFPLLSTSISSSLHLLGNRNYLSPCKGASSIPWFIARCHRNGSFFDWIEGVPAFVSLPGHSYMWWRWLLNERFIF